MTVIIHDDIAILSSKMSFSMHLFLYYLHSQVMKLRMLETRLGSKRKRPWLKLKCLEKADIILDKEGEGNLKSKHMEPGSQDFILTQVVAVFSPLAWVQPHNFIRLLLEKELAHRKWWTKRKGAPAPRTNGSLLQAIKFREQSRGPFSGDLCCTGHSKKERPPRMLF